MKIAIVCDWLATIGGAEKVLIEMLACFPNADIFSLVDFLPHESRYILQGKTVQTSFIQKLPFAKNKFRNYLSLMPLAIEQFDFINYDIIISSSHAIAKGVLTGPSQIHICYCHSPIRYAWDLQNQYLRESNLDRGLKSLIIRFLLHKIRLWDAVSTKRVDYFIANSKFIAARINKYYRRTADAVIYPPVITEVTANIKREDFYLTASRLVPYKKVDLIVEAFLHMPDKKLVVIGSGPKLEYIQQIAAGYSNIQILGFQEDAVLHDYLARAKGFVFAAEEDFGILPVEAQAFGCPVIAYKKGGVLETVIDFKVDSNTGTGVFFEEQTVASLMQAISFFEENHKKFSVDLCHKNALGFSRFRFRHEFKEFILEKYKNFNLA